MVPAEHIYANLEAILQELLDLLEFKPKVLQSVRQSTHPMEVHKWKYDSVNRELNYRRHYGSPFALGLC